MSAHDVLGGSWADPSGRWQEVRTRVAAWSQTNNTFPALPSHPQRVVGWASLTLAAPTLELAREYAGHAQLHVRITREALNGCWRKAAALRDGPPWAATTPDVRMSERKRPDDGREEQDPPRDRQVRCLTADLADRHDVNGPGRRQHEHP